MRKLTQRRFAELFRNAMKERQIEGKALATALGANAVTISRWRNPTYKSGPPRAKMRRLLERELGLVEGALDDAPATPGRKQLKTAGDEPSGTRQPAGRTGDYDARVERIAGTVARVIAQAIHNAVAQDEATKTRKGQIALGQALSHFAAELDDEGFSVGGLIRVADLLRDGQL